MAESSTENNLAVLHREDAPFAFLERELGAEYLEYRKRWALASERKEFFRVPLHLDLDMNNACNMACVNCNALTARNLRGRKYTARLDLLKKRLEEAIPLGVRAVNFGNCSEPLISSNEVFDLIGFVRGLGVTDILMHTNGLLLEGDAAGRVIESGVTKLCISLDAATAETFHRIGRVGYERVVSNIHNFLRARAASGSMLPVLRLSFCPNQDNYHEIAGFRDKWRGMADLLEVQSLYDMRDGKTSTGLKKTTNDFCADPWRRLVIWPNNTYGACCQHFAFNPECPLNLGSLDELTIEEAWNLPGMTRLRESLVTKSFYRECLECMNNRYAVEL